MRHRSTLILLIAMVIVGCTSSPNQVPTLTTATRQAVVSSPSTALESQDSQASFAKIKTKVRSFETDVVLIDFSITAESLDLDPNGAIIISSDKTVELIESNFDGHKTVKSHETYTASVKVRIKDEGLQKLSVTFPFRSNGIGPINPAAVVYLEFKNKKLKELSPQEYDKLLDTQGAEGTQGIIPGPCNTIQPCIVCGSQVSFTAVTAEG